MNMNPSNANEMYCIEPLQEVIETVMYTASVQGSIPSSLILVGPSGIGKSMMLSRYSSENLRHSDSISSQGLFEIASQDHKGAVRFLLIPDINPTLSRKASTVQATIANLLSFTADGTVRVDDGRREKECKHSPIGLITAATNEMYDKQAKKWFALGLRRRIIPIFFRYSASTKDKLQKLVRQNKIQSMSPKQIPINLPLLASPPISDEMNMEIQSLSHQFAQHLGKLAYFHDNKKKWAIHEVVAIAPQITLMTLLRAHALRAKRTPTQEDYEFLLRFVDFCDPEHPKEI